MEPSITTEARWAWDTAGRIPHPDLRPEEGGAGPDLVLEFQKSARTKFKKSAALPLTAVRPWLSPFTSRGLCSLLICPMISTGRHTSLFTEGRHWPHCPSLTP